MAETEALLRAALTGAGQLVLVDGPPGIGKTAFLQTVAVRAKALGLSQLAARAGELEQGFAFGIVRQLFERRLAASPASGRKELLAGAAAFAAPVFTPHALASETSPDALHPALHGLYWLTANLAARAPLLLVVDDAHWADSASMRFLEYLAHRLDGLPAAVLIASRSSGVDPLRALALEPGATTIHLPLLSERGVGALVEARLGSATEPEVTNACYSATGGNPFLLDELLMWLATADDPLAALHGPPPPNVQTSVSHRLSRLSSAAQALATAAAVLDLEATVSQTSRLAGVALIDVGPAADELVRAGLLTTARPFQFTHALVRAAVLAGVAHAERSVSHARAARLLLDEGADVGIVARHLAESDPLGEEWATDALRRAAQHALAHADPGSAVTWLRRCLDEPLAVQLRAAVLHELGIAEQRLGDLQAEIHLRQAFNLAQDPVARAETLRALLLQLLSTGSGDEVLRMLDATLPQLATRDVDLARRVEAEVLSAARHSVSSSLWAAD
ncbi:MAG TPA: AAA family ATPase, partial [Hyphomicrobiaceae bacterium]